MQPIDLESIRLMSVDDRLNLVEAIWDSIDAEMDLVPLTEEQRAELDRRLEDMEANPHSGEDWERVRARLRKKT